MRKALKLISALLLLSALFSGAQASAAGIIDYSDSQEDYGRAVARMNRSAPMQLSPYPKEEKKAMTAVLCRTDGDEFDFSPWEPQYVIAGPRNRFTLFFADEKAAAAAAEEIAACEEIIYAEVDGEVHAAGSFSSWGAEEMNYGEYLDYSSQFRSSAASATVAVIDSGVYLHPAYASRVLAGGYDYVDGDGDPTNDLFGHGTSVAGVIADCASGAAVYLYPIRVLDASGRGKLSNLANAVLEAIDSGVTVINLSLESAVFSQALDEAIYEAVGSGVTVVASAGNSGIDTSNVCPAHITAEGVIVVGSAESDGSRASYSNYGESVDVYAYGTAISACSRSGGYTTFTGTSAAAPHVSALSALIRLLHTSASPAEIEARICASCEKAALCIPNLSLMIPKSPGFYLNCLRIDLNDAVALPTGAFPESAMEDIAYSSGNAAVITVENGILIPHSAGEAVITASCTGLEPLQFTVAVGNDECSSISIPAGVLSIEEEAFVGDSSIAHVVLPQGAVAVKNGAFSQCGGLKTVSLPDSVIEIEDNPFSSAVILCRAGSFAEQYAIENGLEYISCAE